MIQISPIVMASPKFFVTVSTDKSNYSPGETVVINGALSDSQGSPVVAGSISIQVVSPLGESIHVDLVYTDSEGQYSDEFPLVQDSPDGSYTIYVTASKSGYEDAITSITFYVGESTSESDFVITVSPPSQTFSPGITIVFELTISSIGGFSHTVILDIDGLPTGSTATFDPPFIVPPSSSILQIQTSSDTPEGTYTLTIIGTGGGKTHSISSKISSAKSGCLIATATYGSELSPEVSFLRGFRDNIVTSTYAGSMFMRSFNAFYYSFSPVIANLISENPFFKNIVKHSLYPLIASLRIAVEVYGLLGFNCEVGVITAGLVASFMIGVSYILPVLFCLIGILIKFSALKITLKNRTRFFLKPIYLIWASSFFFIAFGEFLVNPYLMSFASSIMVLSTILMPTAITLWILSRKA